MLKTGSSFPPFIRAICLAAAILFAASPIFADDDPAARDELARQVQQKVEQLHALRVQRLKLQQQQATDADTLGQQTDRLTDQLAETQQQLAAAQQTLQQLEQSIAVDQRTIDRDKQWLTAAAAEVRSLAAAAAAQARSAPPLKDVDPAADLADAEHSLTDAADLQHTPAAIQSTLQIVGDDLVASRQVELTNEPVMLESGQRRVHAWRLRIGLAGAVFASEDGHTTGYWSPRQSDHWQLNPPPQTSRMIQNLIIIARGQQQPALTPAPIPLLDQPIAPRPATEGATP